MSTAIALKPGDPLYRRVRAEFVARGDSLNEWCTRNGHVMPYARQVLLGERNGPAARELRQRLATAAGLLPPPGPIRMASDIETSEAA